MQLINYFSLTRQASRQQSFMVRRPGLYQSGVKNIAKMIDRSAEENYLYYSFG